MLGTAPDTARETDPPDEREPEERAESGRPAILRPDAWRDMLRYLRPQRRLILLGGGLSLLGGFSGLIQPVIAKSVVENLESRSPVMAALIALTALVLVSAVVGAIGTFILMRVSESVVLSTRREVIRRVLWLRVAETDKIPPGDLMSRATADTTLMRSAVTTAIVETVNGTTENMTELVQSVTGRLAEAIGAGPVGKADADGVRSAKDRNFATRIKKTTRLRVVVTVRDRQNRLIHGAAQGWIVLEARVPGKTDVDDKGQSDLSQSEREKCPEAILLMLGGDFDSKSQLGVFVYSRKRGSINWRSRRSVRRSAAMRERARP